MGEYTGLAKIYDKDLDKKFNYFIISYWTHNRVSTICKVNIGRRKKQLIEEEKNLRLEK